MLKYSSILKSYYPQNDLIRNPFRGALITVLFSFIFLVLYIPFEIDPQNYPLGFKKSMAIYCLAIIIPQIIIVNFVKKLKFFAFEGEWNILKEFSIIIITLLGIGIFIYIMGFVVEGPDNRLNFSNFFSSIKIVFLVGIVLYGFFSAFNFKYKRLIAGVAGEASSHKEKLIHINSQLKKEELSFYPSQFIFATSNSNYVVFYLKKGNTVQKEMIRNSITNVENQLCSMPDIFRTHRAFIVNLKKIKNKTGNSLGYKLQLDDIEEEIPVARNKTDTFIKFMNQLH